MRYPTNRPPLKRMNEIDHSLRSGRPTDCSLARELEVDPGTIRRGMEFMRSRFRAPTELGRATATRSPAIVCRPIPCPRRPVCWPWPQCAALDSNQRLPPCDARSERPLSRLNPDGHKHVTESSRELQALASVIEQEQALSVFMASPLTAVLGESGSSRYFSGSAPKALGEFTSFNVWPFPCPSPRTHRAQPMENHVQGSGHATVLFRRSPIDPRTPLCQTDLSPANATRR
jgi:hypothetical protein